MEEGAPGIEPRAPLLLPLLPGNRTVQDVLVQLVGRTEVVTPDREVGALRTSTIGHRRPRPTTDNFLVGVGVHGSVKE